MAKTSNVALMIFVLSIFTPAAFAQGKGVSIGDDVTPLEQSADPAPSAPAASAPAAEPGDNPRTSIVRPGATGTDAAEDQVEQLLDNEDAKTDQAVLSKPRGPEKPPLPAAQSLSDLANLAPFSDIAVIQRRFLPKTGRFELSGSGFTNLNNPFYNSLGASLRAAYYFREQYALEVIAAAFGTMARQSTNDLEKNRAISTDNVVTSKSFGALSFKWNPIYGKITWLNKGIVPFDLNFSAGGGLTQTTDGNSQPTLHLGTSQVFALSKWVAFRWDLMWNLYKAETTNSKNVKEELLQNDLFLGVGMSLYFPEASYR